MVDTLNRSLNLNPVIALAHDALMLTLLGLRVYILGLSMFKCRVFASPAYRILSSLAEFSVQGFGFVAKGLGP